MIQAKIGFIGLGRMGKPMAKNLTKGRYEITVYDVVNEAVEEMVELGAKRAVNSKEVARACEVIISMVRDDTQTEMVMWGEGGIFEGIKPGSTIIITSTASPSLCQKIAREASGRGAKVLDAPVSGAVPRAEAGTLSLMVGGNESLFEEVRPILETMGKDIFYVGDIGMGQVAKLANNLALANSLSSAVESINFATKFGVQLDKILKILNKSTGNSWVIEHWHYMTQRPMDLLYKDVQLAFQEADKMGIELPLGSVSLSELRKQVQGG